MEQLNAPVIKEPTVREIEDTLLNLNISESDYYIPIKKGKFVFFFGPGTGIVLFSTDVLEEICYSFLTIKHENEYTGLGDFYGLRETWEDEWRVSPFLEGDLKCLLAAKEYLENFSTKRMMNICITGSSKKTYGYYLPWTDSKKMTYDRT